MAKSPESRRSQPRGRVTRTRVLRAAEQLFTRQGFADTTVSEVARRASVGVGTLYHHFPDKRAILLDLIDDWGERAGADRRTDFDHARFLGDDPRGGFAGWLRSAYDRLRKQPSLYLVVLALADRDEEVRRRYQRIERVAVERLRDLLDFGQRRGLMRAGFDAASAAFLIHHAIDMAATQLLVREVSDPAPDRVLEELTDMIARYVLEEA